MLITFGRGIITKPQYVGLFFLHVVNSIILYVATSSENSIIKDQTSGKDNPCGGSELHRKPGGD